MLPFRRHGAKPHGIHFLLEQSFFNVLHWSESLAGKIIEMSTPEATQGL